MDLGVLLKTPQGSRSSSRVEACTSAFLPSCSSLSRFPLRGSRNLWLSLEVSHEGFPRGFPTGLSHGPPCCDSILGLKVEAVQGNRFSWNRLRHLRDSGNGGMTLESLSPFLWRAPPLEMRRERREFITNHTGKGSLLSSYEADTGLLWMWVGRSCFLSSGDGYVGELLELQQGCQGHFGIS